MSSKFNHDALLSRTLFQGRSPSRQHNEGAELESRTAGPQGLPYEGDRFAFLSSHFTTGQHGLQECQHFSNAKSTPAAHQHLQLDSMPLTPPTITPPWHANLLVFAREPRCPDNVRLEVGLSLSALLAEAISLLVTWRSKRCGFANVRRFAVRPLRRREMVGRVNCSVGK